MKIEESCKSALKSVALCNLLLTIIENVAFLIIGKWGIDVLLGSALGYVWSILNFFFLTISVHNVLKRDKKQAQAYMQATYTFRMIFLGVGLVLAAALPSVNWVAAAIPYVFTRISIMIIQLKTNKEA